MQVVKQVGATLVLGAVIAACGVGGGPATQAPGGNGGHGGGTPTELPAATQSGGGGGVGGIGGDTSKGTGHVDISGPATKSVDLAFTPILSHFGGTEDTVLYLQPTSGDQGARPPAWQGGPFIATFTGTDIVITGSECSTSNLKLEAASASGEWECPSNIVVLGSGASAQNAGFKGKFDVKG